MSDMVERVARALCRKHYFDRFGDDDLSLVEINVNGNWHLHEADAGAAIAAMAEPTEAMVAAIEAKARERYEAAPAMMRWYGDEVWQAGIAEALR